MFALQLYNPMNNGHVMVIRDSYRCRLSPSLHRPFAVFHRPFTVLWPPFAVRSPPVTAVHCCRVLKERGYENPVLLVLLNGRPGELWLKAAIYMDNPYCSC